MIAPRPTSEPLRIAAIIPELQVANIAASVRSYRDALGFGLDFAWSDIVDAESECGRQSTSRGACANSNSGSNGNRMRCGIAADRPMNTHGPVPRIGILTLGLPVADIAAAQNGYRDTMGFTIGFTAAEPSARWCATALPEHFLSLGVLAPWRLILP